MTRRRPIPTTDPTLAVAYIRVSTEEQRLGPDAQRATIISWASAKGIRMAEWCEDLGVSGGAAIEKSLGLLQALYAIKRHAAGVLVTQKRDRLARDIIRAAVLESTAERAGARIVTTEGDESGTDDPSAWLLRTLKDAFSQFERLQTAAWTRAALAVKRQRRERVETVPYGYALDAAGHLAELDLEQHAIGTGGASLITNITAGTSISDMELLDIDLDGDLDLVIANFGTHDVGILLNQAGALSPTVAIGVGLNPTSLAVGDVNGDGREDAATANSGSNNLTVLFGDGSGGFSSFLPVPSTGTPAAVEIADTTNDGLLDLAEMRDVEVAIHRNGGAGVFLTGPTIALNAPCRSLVRCDPNNDGRPDLGICLGQDAGFAILRATTTGISDEPIYTGTLGSLEQATLVDLNGDGRSDLAGAGPKGLLLISNSSFGGTISTYGVGCPGSGGFIPTLAGSGTVAPGGAISIALSNTLGGASGLLVVGISRASLPLNFSCDLLVAPPFILIPLGIPGAGSGFGALGFSVDLPEYYSPIPSVIDLQVLVADPGGTGGVSASNAVELKFVSAH